MKIASIVGARPQFIKCAPIVKIMADKCEKVLIHTGQHYNYVLSKIFFDQLEIPKPDYNLGVGSALHGYQSGKMMIKIEKVLLKEHPDYVIVYGDTNSTLAGALASVKLNIPCVHIEAGLRSRNKEMPEEINRIVTDHVSNILFCPSATAIKNLKKEGLSGNAELVGDVMMDVLLDNEEKARSLCNNVLIKYSIEEKKYNVLTIHRAENTKSTKEVLYLIKNIESISPFPIIFPVHPRLKKILSINKSKDISIGKIQAVDPVSYLEMLALIIGSDRVITDSGGLQKDAYYLQKPCITLRKETEWIETLENGWNILVGTDKFKIENAFNQYPKSHINRNIYGTGNTSKKICQYFFK